MWIDNLRFRSKLFILVSAAFLGMALVFGMALSSLDDELLSARKLQVQQLMESAYKMVAHYEQEARAGHMGEEEAKAAALADLRSMRYGDNNYFWVHNMDVKMVMHPIKPDLEGKDVNILKDAAGTSFIPVMNEIVKKQGGGFHYYDFPKPGFDKPVRKVSYVQGVPSWGWVIGTGIYLDDVAATFRRVAIGLGATVATIGLVVVGLSLLIAHRVTSSLGRLAGSMARLAAGDLDIHCDDANRRDEIGDMSRSLVVFRDTALDAREMRQRQEDERHQHEREKAESMRVMATDFDNSVKARVAEVTRATTGIGTTAMGMADRSQSSGSHSLEVGEAATISNERAAIAAEATRQLSLAIDEIAKQVAHSTGIAQKAVEEVNATATQMSGLANSVQSIGEIVNLINDIAAQTNLLALNATIEAARAGEAGKGFAVVANEVKHLATQTAKATDDIARQVAEVQDSSRAMAGSITGVVDTIRSLDEISSAIAGAVQEQEASTREIASNIEEVAHQSEAVSKTVTELAKASARTCAGTVRVIWSANSLMGVVNELSGETEGFLDRVRQ